MLTLSLPSLNPFPALLDASSHRLRAPGRYAVGLERHAFQGPMGRREAWLFFPAEPGTRETQLRYGQLFRGLIAREAKWARGPFPLVLLSHGHQAATDELAWLGERAAAAGVVALAVAHPNDTLDVAALVARRDELRAALDWALGDTELGPRLDSARIAVAGHSFGGATALAFAGARPRGASSPEGRPSASLRGVVATAPGSQALFDGTSLSSVAVPVVLVAGDADEVTPLDQNAERFLAQIPQARLVRVPGAGHFLFKPPCTLWGRWRVPWLCRDARGVERSAWHDRVASELLRLLAE